MNMQKTGEIAKVILNKFTRGHGTGIKKAAFIVVAALLLIAGAAYADISGCPHDLSSYPGADPNISPCMYCHVVHGACTDCEAPLWNSQALPLPDATLFTLYDSGQGGVGSEETLSDTRVNQPGSQSLICLSCHDGAITQIAENSPANFHYDLSTSHPVGVEYIPYSTDHTNESGLADFDIGGITIGGGIYITFTTNGKQRVECASCHDLHGTCDPHDPKFPFLRGDRNQICTTCHALK